MTVVTFRFLAGRYHATGWDHHVNEGTIEWPPSPWRILRTLVAASYRLPTLPARALLGRLVEKLSVSDPSYWVPRASAAHVRHYMPTTGDTTTKVLDAFAAVGLGPDDPAAELAIGWPDVELSAEEAELLDALLEQIGYLGRAESWVEGRRLTSGAPAWNAEPTEGAGPEYVRLQAPLSAAELAEWVDRTRPTLPKGVTVPTTLLEVLHQDTERLFKAGWTDAPGTRWVTYRFAHAPFRSTARRQQQSNQMPSPDFARFAVASTVPPRLVDAVPLAERLRDALMAWSREGEEARPSPIFAGKDADGRPLDGNRHAHLLAVDEDCDGRVEFLDVWAPAGFGPREVKALQGVATRGLWSRSGHDIRLVLLHLGHRHPDGRGTSVPARALSHSANWRSSTPFVCPRHAKVRGGRLIDGPEDQVRRALRQAGLPEPQVIERVDHADTIPALPWYRFVRTRRSGGGAIADHRGYGFRLTFAEPVQGPIAIGYGAHFGLGQFVPLKR